MARITVTAVIGRPDVASVTKQLNRAIGTEVARATVRRTQARSDHRSVRRLRGVGYGNGQFWVKGPTGGPGPIYPRVKKALAWTSGGQRFVRKFVKNGTGFPPLIIAEGNRVTTADLKLEGIIIK